MEKMRIAIYIRLSMADEDTGKGKEESDSIINQRNLIHQFLDCHAELSKYSRTEFVDDGFTGTNTNRPAFQNMIGQIREGRFGVCITKDFSRFSRDYIEIGDYLECVFPFLQVRYISINDGYDSEAYKGTTGGLEMVMRNIVYASYSKDLSAKATAGKMQSMKKGRRTSGLPPFGYKRDPQRKSMNVIDPEAAEIVREIFDLALGGANIGKIAQKLNDEKIPTPAVYFRMKNPESDKFKNMSPNQSWSYDTVLNILRRYTYTGASVGHQTKCVVPCSKSLVKVRKEEQIIVPGMHEAIVTEEEYNQAQKIVKKVERTRATESIVYPLKSLVYCGNCERHMMRYKNLSRFRCTHGRQDRGSICRKVRSPLEADMEKMVFQSIQNFISMADERQTRLKLEQDRQKVMVQNDLETTAVLRAKIESLKKEKLKVYENYCTGKLDKNSYILRKGELDEKIAEYEYNICMFKEHVKGSEESVSVSYTELETAVSIYKVEECLTHEMAQTFIDKIIVYPEERMEIQWKFKDCFLNTSDQL